ncbi:MAG TPA: TonB-dependent receptor [Bryobacteraceae bacterium]
MLFKKTLAIFALCMGIASAQYRASLQGTVTDATGGIIPGAKVTLTSTETNVTRTTTTSDTGVYAFSNLAPGAYTLTVERTGFAKQEISGVTIASEQAQGRDVRLQVGAPTAQTVTVSASENPVLDTANANLSSTLSSQQIQSLPTFGRDPFMVAQLASGTFGDNSRSANGGNAQNLPGSAGPGGSSSTTSIFQTENQVQISANGTRNASNSFQIDGIEVNSLAWGGAAVITPNEESVKEVTVQSNPYSAENGRNSGAQVLVVSKNGTNEFHGSALLKATRPGLNAFQRYNGPNKLVQRDNDRFNQWAGSIGGPIVKNRLFFFFSYETLRSDTTALNFGWYETPQFLNTIKSAVPNSIAAKYASYPGEGVSYNAIIPFSCASAGFPAAGCQAITDSSGKPLGLDIGSPLHLPLGATDPTFVNNGNPGVGGGLDGIPDIMNVQTTNPTSTNPQQFNGRIDYHLTDRDLLVFSTYYVPVSKTNYNGPTRAANLWHNDRTNEAATILWTHTISPSWLNEARVGVTRWLWDEIGSNPQAPFGLPQAKVDNMGSANLQFLGAPGPSIFNQTTYNVRDTVSSVKGSHSFKFGVDILKEQDNDNSAPSGRPTYSFRNIWNLANDAPYQETGNFNPLTGFPSRATKYIRSEIYGVFFQDDWKIRPNLTLNLGLRWEYFTPVSEKHGNISNPLLGPQPNPLFGLKLKVGGDLYNASKNNWGPQIGFAWRPNPSSQRWVLRGGAGAGYNRMQQAVTLNGRSNPPLIAGLTLTGANILYQVPSDPTAYNGFPLNHAAILQFDPSTGLPGSGTSVDLTGFPTNLPTPVTYRYSFESQYELANSWVSKVGYQGSLSRHLTIQNNVNLHYTPLNPQVTHLYFFDNIANASYNALLAELEKRFSHNFQLDFQYRWSHTIDGGSNDYFIGPYPFGQQYNKGSADYDVRHNFKLYGLWTPQIFKNGGWAEKIFGGWELSGILNAHTGYPWSPFYTNTSCNLVYPNSGYCNLRPAGYLGGAGTDYSNDAFKMPSGNFPNGALAYLTVPTFPSMGIPPAPSVGRNVFTGPGYFNVDMALQKSFGLPRLPIFGENARFQFRADLFNIFNKTNLVDLNNGGNPFDANIISTNGTTSNPLFGQPQAALSGRIVQLQARFSF